MDAKSLREAMKSKAKRLASSSTEKVDSSDYTAPEKLNAEAKTDMRPIKRRAFKAGGKVEGSEVERRADRTPRMNGSKIGLANTDQKSANEEREGVKHVGGFKKGGMAKKADGGMASSLRPKARPAGLDTSGITQEGLDSTARSNESAPDGRSTSPRPMPRPDDLGIDVDKVGRDSMIERKRGGKAEKFEGSAKDKMQDKKLAAKRNMSMADWEKSKADDKHDAQQSMKGLKAGGKACDDDDKSAGGARMARKSGGRAGKGKTNINIIISPHSEEKPAAGMPPVAPPMMAPKPPMPPMPSGPSGPLPAGLGAALAGAAGAPPMGGGAGMPPHPPMGGAAPPMQPMMARKSGGKVYPKMHAGAGSGEGRLEKVEKYGMKSKG